MKSVLVADDSQIILLVMRKRLAAFGDQIVVRTAVSGGAALEAWRQQRPDLTILDVVMPDLDGTEVLSSIMAEEPSARVLMVSSCRSSEVEQLCLEKGARGFLVKDQSDLLKAVGEILELRRGEAA